MGVLAVKCVQLMPFSHLAEACPDGSGLLCRRVLVMEFIRGQSLASLPKHEIRSLVEVGQNAFLVQLLDVGYLHAGQHHPRTRPHSLNC